jgi:hypothetical protein
MGSVHEVYEKPFPVSIATEQDAYAPRDAQEAHWCDLIRRGATVGRVAFVQLEKLFRECMAAGQTEPTPRHVEIILLAGGIGSFICTPTALISKPVAFADVVAELGHSRTLRA